MIHPAFSPARSLFLALALAFAAGPANVRAESGTVEQRLKTALNAMVRDVHEAETPAAKRAVLERFLGNVEGGARLMGRMPLLSEENRVALNALQEKFGGYSADLRAEPGSGTSPEGVADGDLDAYASYVQQDLEQAANGGIYLSTGAVIIILLIILIIL